MVGASAPSPVVGGKNECLEAIGGLMGLDLDKLSIARAGKSYLVNGGYVWMDVCMYIRYVTFLKLCVFHVHTYICLLCVTLLLLSTCPLIMTYSFTMWCFDGGFSLS